MSSDDRSKRQGRPGGTAPGPSAIPELTDPRAMRALAHPIRLALLEALSEAGQLTATAAAEVVGESPSTCSFHLRQLAKYGLVEEAGGGRGRERPWRRADVGFRFTDVHDDPATAEAAAGLDRVLRARYVQNMQAGMEARRGLPREWREATGASQFLLFVTPQELRELDDELTALLLRYQDRVRDPALRPEGSRRIEALLVAYPQER